MSTALKMEKLCDVAELNPKYKEKLESDSSVSFVPMAAVLAETSTVTGEEKQYCEVSKGYTSFTDGDVLVAKITPCFENGKITQAKLKHKVGFGSTEFHVVRPLEEKLDARYLLHFLRQERIRLEGERKMTGSAGQRRVPANFLASLEIPLPPLEEQKRIADILDRAEALRAKRRAALAQLDELTQSIFTEMFGDPVINPKNWKLEKVQDVISQIEAGWSANGDSRPREENEYAVLKVSAVTQGVFLPEECKVINNNIEFKKVVTPEKGDVLFSRANTLELVGASCLIRENYPYLLLPDKLWKIRVNEEKICPQYFKFVLSYPTSRHEISKRSTGTSGSMYNISMDKFRLIKITVPPIPIQCEFARRITFMEKLKAAHEASLAELDELFASLQYRAFRGEL